MESALTQAFSTLVSVTSSQWVSLCSVTYSRDVRHGTWRCPSHAGSPVAYGHARGEHDGPSFHVDLPHGASRPLYDDERPSRSAQRLSYDGLRRVLTWAPPVNDSVGFAWKHERGLVTIAQSETEYLADCRPLALVVPPS